MFLNVFISLYTAILPYIYISNPSQGLFLECLQSDLQGFCECLEGCAELSDEMKIVITAAISPAPSHNFLWKIA
jgi:hypothetical protein